MLSDPLSTTTECVPAVEWRSHPHPGKVGESPLYQGWYDWSKNSVMKGSLHDLPLETHWHREVSPRLPPPAPVLQLLTPSSPSLTCGGAVSLSHMLSSSGCLFSLWGSDLITLCLELLWASSSTILFSHPWTGHNNTIDLPWLLRKTYCFLHTWQRSPICEELMI